MDWHCFAPLGYQWRRHSAKHPFWVSKHKAILGWAIGNWVVSVAHEMPVATICWELVGNACHYHVDNTWKCVDKCQWPRYVETRWEHVPLPCRQHVEMCGQMPVATICWGLVGYTCHYPVDATWKCLDKYHVVTTFLVLRCRVAASWWPWGCVSWDALFGGFDGPEKFRQFLFSQNVQFFFLWPQVARLKCRMGNPPHRITNTPVNFDGSQ